jgi:predicted O-linked N-acetylglucosamine transferase (SPINDLY family)
MDPIEQAFQAAVRRHQAGDSQGAAEVYQQILQQRPDHAGAWQLLGLVHRELGELAAALKHLRRAIELSDAQPAAWNNLGVVLKDLGRRDEAQAAFERALRLLPDYPDAWANLGLVHLESGRLDDAEHALRQAMRLAPRHADALRQLAACRLRRGDLQEALRFARDAIAVAPARAASHLLLGKVLAGLRRFEEAADAYRKAVEMRPTHVEAHLNLGLACAELDDVEPAREAFGTAATLRPDRPMWRLRELSLCPTVMPSAESIREYREELERRLDEALTDPPRMDWRQAMSDGFVPSFSLVHHGQCNRTLMEKFARLFAPAFPRERPTLARRPRLRIGMLATAGHEGGLLRSYGGVLERLDRREFEVVGLVPPPALAHCRQTVQAADVRWVGLADELERAAKTVVEAQCDVLLHWQVDMDTLGYFLAFLPLAPVQCLGFGSHGTSGIANLDYCISSQLFERGDDAAEDYSEQLVQFTRPHCWQPRPAAVAPASREVFGLPAQGALYFCPHRLAKFHPDFDPVLRRILEEDPDGHLVVLQGRLRPTAALHARWDRTIGKTLARRVLFVPHQGPEDYSRLLSLATAVLDVPTYSSCLTGYDALACGVPLVTLPGRYMVQRYVAGLYAQMGMQDLMAADEEAYVRLAVELGRNGDFREAMSRQIVERCDVLFEDDAVVREYEAFFRQAAQARES